MEYKCAKQANEVDSSVGAIGKKDTIIVDVENKI